MARVKSTPVKRRAGTRYVMYKKRSMSMRKRRKTPMLKRMAKKARLEVGLPLSTRPTTKQRVMLSESATTDANRTLYSVAMTDIPSGATGSTREKNKVNVLGFQVKFFVQNTTGAPIYMRYAFITPRSAPNIALANFLLGPDGAERGLDFGTGRSGIQLCFSSINPDLYTILKQGKRKLIGNTSTDNVNNNTQYLKMWLPLKRIITFDQTSSILPQGDNVYFCWWYDNPLNAAATPASNVTVRAIQAVTYFRDD